MNTWLDEMLGGSSSVIFWIILAVLVLVVLLVLLRLIRTLRSGTYIAGGRNRAPRLAVVDAAAVDGQRRLVLVRRDDTEHLILIGGPTDLVIEPGIRADDHERALSVRQMKVEPTPAPVAPPRRAPAAATRRNPERPEPVPAPAPSASSPVPPVEPSAPRRHAVAVTPPERADFPPVEPDLAPERPHATVQQLREPAMSTAVAPERRVPHIEPVDIGPRRPAEPSNVPLETSLEEEMGRLLEDISVEDLKRR